MATRIGGQYDDTTATAPVVRTFTAGAGAVLYGKFEGGAGVVPAASFTDPGGNGWTRIALNYHATGSEPGLVIYLCTNIVSSGSVTVTIPYTGTGTFLQAGVEEWSKTAGTTFAVDSVTSANGSGGGGSGTYNAVGTAVSSAAGFAVLAVAEFASLATPAGGGTPAFALTVPSTANGDSLSAYAAVAAASTSVTPSITVTSGFTRSVQTLVLIKEVTAGGATPKQLMTTGVG